jgi:flagellar basal body-associated protein FliL
MEYNYNKKSIWKWVLIYIVIGAVVYAGIYYFFFYNKGGYTYNSQGTKNNYPTQTQNNY